MVARNNYVYGNAARVIEPVRKQEKKKSEEKVIVKDVWVYPALGISNMVLLIMAAVLIVSLSIITIKHKKQYADNKTEIMAMSAKLDKLTLENDIEEDRILNSVNYNEIYNKAIALGMRDVSADQVIKFNRDSFEYVKQYKNIP